MPIENLRAQYSNKDLKFGPKAKGSKLINKYYSGHNRQPHDDFLFGFLCLIYDGITDLKSLKAEMRLMFISATRQVVLEDNDIEELFQRARREKLIQFEGNTKLKLTEIGKELVELSYFSNLHTSYWMGLFFSKFSVILISVLFLVILSSLKIITGLQLDSQGMLTEGFENLTDLVKSGIIILIGMKFKKDKLASFIIILLMIFTGISLIWSGIEALFNQTPITPTIQAYFIGFISIALNSGMMYLKGMVGRNSGNLSILSDAKDSELNVKLSIGVLIGLTFAIFNLYFVDAIVGIAIAFFVFKEGIEIILELRKKEEEFDISSIKVYADNIYDNRLTGYILGSIRRDPLTQKKLIENFSKGLSLGRKYYLGFADFFYNELSTETAKKHVDKLLEGGFIDTLGEELVLTKKGLKSFYRAKVKEFRERSNNIQVKSYSIFKIFYCLLFLTIITLLIIFAPQINNFLNSF